jgi:hypothetical protein
VVILRRQPKARHAPSRKPRREVLVHDEVLDSE